MKLLLDTHVFLWAIDSRPLGNASTTAFYNPDNVLFFSAASYWEVCIKLNIGKLSLQADWADLFDREMSINGIQWLPIERKHGQTLVNLPLLHRDPFDRLLIAQAKAEGMTILTADRYIQQYDVPTLW